MVTFLLFVGTILVLVGTHEAAHFLAGKLLGVYVKEFAIGFGPKLFSFTRRGTRYSIRVIPFGGYVRFAGEDRQETSDEIPSQQLLYNKPPIVRMFVSLSGPLANLVMAFLVLITVLWAFGLPYISVVDVMPDKPATSLLVPGDRLLSIEGRSTFTTTAVSEAIQRSDGAPLRFEVLRDGEQQSIDITPEYDTTEGRYIIGIYFGVSLTTTVTAVGTDSLLFRAGLQAGDVITVINGSPVSTGLDLIESIQASLPADRVEITANRAGIPTSISVAAAGLEWNELLAGLALGFDARRPGFVAGLALGAEQFGEYVKWLVLTVRGLFSGRIPVSEAVSGPVGIARQLSEAYRQGPSIFLSIFGLFSLWLGLLNLIPFPALDGSRAAFALYELVRRKPIPPQREGLIHTIGFLILIAVMVLVTYQDIIRLFR